MVWPHLGLSCAARQGAGFSADGSGPGTAQGDGGGWLRGAGDPGFYGRFGFVSEPGLTLLGVPAEYFMARSFGAVMPRGEVCYHPAFVQE